MKKVGKQKTNKKGKGKGAKNVNSKLQNQRNKT